MVRCKMNQCPYYDVRGICAKQLLSIDENGMCETLWRRGQQRRMATPFTEEQYPKKEYAIFDVNFKIAETPFEDPQDGIIVEE